MVKKVWTPKDDAQFISEWENGTSRTDLAFLFDCSKTTISKHAKILGLIQRPKYFRKERPKKIKAPALEAPLKSPDEGISILELTDTTCRWLIDNRLYCGKVTATGSPYCSKHHRMSIQHKAETVK